MIPAINTLPKRGIEIFGRVGLCPGDDHTSLLLKLNGLFARYKSKPANLALWKSSPETGAIAAAIGVRCEDNLYRPTVDGHLPLVATPAVHRTDSSKNYLLSKRDPIEIEPNVILLVDSQDFGPSDNDPVMSIQEIAYRDRKIKFHRDPVAL
jgi:hypothetical protein